MFVVLYSRYKSAALSALIMVNVLLALVGAVIGLWLSDLPLSVAELVGFITLAGISVRTGILKVSHYINLMRFEGESFDHKMILRVSLERLSPVLMTALVTAFALPPLLFEAEQLGTEVLHPVAVVIFSGLISSTLLETFLTPAMYWLFGRKPADALRTTGMPKRCHGALAPCLLDPLQPKRTVMTTQAMFASITWALASSAFLPAARPRVQSVQDDPMQPVGKLSGPPETSPSNRSAGNTEAADS
jgi:predicted RND superfamily exporter protein